MAFQLMQVRTRISHIFLKVRGIESIQNIRKPLRVSRLNSLLCSIEKEVFKSLVSEGLYHLW
jgi:hypothetical protein